MTKQHKFTVDVSLSTHDALKDGVTTLRVHTVHVLAPTGDDATVTAMLMPASRGWLPTGATVIVWDDDAP